MFYEVWGKLQSHQHTARCDINIVTLVHSFLVSLYYYCFEKHAKYSAFNFFQKLVYLMFLVEVIMHKQFTFVILHFTSVTKAN